MTNHCVSAKQKHQLLVPMSFRVVNLLTRLMLSAIKGLMSMVSSFPLEYFMVSLWLMELVTCHREARSGPVH